MSGDHPEFKTMMHLTIHKTECTMQLTDWRSLLFE